MSIGITPTDIEARFGTPAGATAFPNFCNAVIVAAGPVVSSLPSLSEKPGPDGGKDGEWLLTDDEAIARSPFTSVGWNVFQFKASGLGAKGRAAAISELNRRLDRALRKLVERHETARVPGQYTAFTNLQLDLETPMVTAAGSRLSTDIERLKESILRDAPAEVRISVVHAATLAALVNAHPTLKLAFFSENIGLSWDEKWAIEQSISPFPSSIPFTGREEEMRRVVEWLGDADTRVIALTGPSGMGKTRLALEATRDRSAQTVVIERADRFEESMLTAITGTNRETILLIEDPSRERAEQIAKYAVAAGRVKVILTIPTKQDAPELRLLGHPAVQALSLGRLNNDSAGKLLEAAKAHFDSRARDWVLLQAGGIPAILLTAAEASAELRENAGKLREQLNRRFSHKVEAKLGTSGLEVLKIMSPLQWVDLGQDSSQIALLLQGQQSSLSENDVRRLLPELEGMGYLRSKGKFVTVVPPLFAAGLARDLFEQTPRVARELFAGLNSTGRERFLERIITLELNEDAPLWSYFFGSEGPFAAPLQIIENLSLLSFLGRAVPRQTVRFLRLHFDTIVSAMLSLEGENGLGELRSVLGELLEEPETSRDAMDFFKLLAVGEIGRGTAGRATVEFCECFVHWYPFPVPYSARTHIVRDLVASSNLSERELGARAVIVATNPPRSLSGRSVNARRLGPEPARQLMRDLWQFLENVIELRFELCGASEAPIAEIARKNFIVAFERLDDDLPILRFLPLIERAIDVHLKGGLGSDDRDARSVLHSLRFRWTKSRDEVGHEQYVSEWTEPLARLDRLIAHFDEAPFVRRLKIAAGRALAYDYEEIEGERLYSYQKRLRALATETIADPTLMTEEAWSVLYDGQAFNAHEFATALGDLDDTHVFASGFEERATDWSTSGLLAFYLAKQRTKHLSWVEERIDALILRSEFVRVAVLQVLKVTGPTPKNVRRLFDMIQAKAITPLEVAQTFSTGKWLDDLPHNDVAVVFAYIATDENITRWLAADLNLYLHHQKPLPRPLFAVARQVLTSPSAQSDGHNYELDHIALGLAKTDFEEGMQLFAEQIKNLGDRQDFSRLGQWNPVEAHGERSFWEHLRDHAPMEAYRILGRFRSPGSWVSFRYHKDHPLLDLTKHGEVLKTIAGEDRGSALVFADALSVKQPGFFDLAYSIIELYPSDSEIGMRLQTATVERAGFGSDLDHLNDALKRVKEQLAVEGLPIHASTWLNGLQNYIAEQQREYGKYFGTHEFLGWD